MAARTVVRKGSTGPDVIELQKLLNQKVAPTPPLVPDGAFGTLTDKALRKYQFDEMLVVDGIAGKCTWNALLGLDTFIHRFPTTLVPQPNTVTCWKASTAMLLAKPITAIDHGPAQLCSDGSIDNSVENMSVYAKHHNLRYNYPMSWMIDALAERMGSRGRLMFHIIWDVHSWNISLPQSGHLVCLAYMRGDGTDDGTTMVFLDPWEPNLGSIQRMSYRTMLKRMPGATASILHK